MDDRRGRFSWTLSPRSSPSASVPSRRCSIEGSSQGRDDMRRPTAGKPDWHGTLLLALHCSPGQRDAARAILRRSEPVDRPPSRSGLQVRPPGPAPRSTMQTSAYLGGFEVSGTAGQLVHAGTVEHWAGFPGHFTAELHPMTEDWRAFRPPMIFRDARELSIPLRHAVFPAIPPLSSIPRGLHSEKGERARPRLGVQLSCNTAEVVPGPV